VDPNLSFWLDVAKAFLGAFFGAGLAFLSNNWFQSRQRRRDNIAAGNLAIAVLARQMDDLLNISKGFLEDREEKLGTRGDKAPPWLWFRPITFPFTQDLHFDYSSLAFLFETGNADVVNELWATERAYVDLVGLVQKHNEIAEAMQKKMQELGIEHRDNVEIAEVEKKLGPQVIQMANTLAQGLVLRFSQGPKKFVNAIAVLRGALVKLYGEKAVSKVKVDLTTRRDVTAGQRI